MEGIWSCVCAGDEQFGYRKTGKWLLERKALVKEESYGEEAGSRVVLRSR